MSTRASPAPDARLGARSPRSVWIIVVVLLGAYAATVAVDLAAYGRLPLPLVALLVSAAPALVAIVLIRVGVRRLGDRRGLSGYGLAIDRRWIIDLLAGLGIGLVAVTVPNVIGIATGALRIVAVFDRGVLALWPGILLFALAMLFTGLWEELVLRGVFVTNAADGLRRWLSPRRAVLGGVLVSAVVFGLAHFAQFTHPAFALTWILSGVILGIVYVLSGNLALVIGAHAAINITGNVLFLRVGTGGAQELSAIMRIQVDPDLSFLGPGGIIDVAMYLAVGLLAVAWLRHSRGVITVQVDALDVSRGPVMSGRSSGADRSEYAP